VSRIEVIGDAQLYLGDCLEILPTLPKVDAVITDPPYGIGYMAPTGVGGECRNLPRRSYEAIYGDNKPFDPMPWLTFSEVVLWGANHYADRLPASAGWLIWDKRDGMTPNNNSDCEIAWLKGGGSARMFRHLWNGMCQASEKGETRAHPTQKPVALMTWCLGFVKARTVLDPYMGSGTTGVACVNDGRSFIGIEREPKYFDIACRRIEQAYKQRPLFEAEPARKPEQLGLEAQS
jgi:site-specific DNA-methyltransferase (adenine-specific)